MVVAMVVVTVVKVLQVVAAALGVVVEATGSAVAVAVVGTVLLLQPALLCTALNIVN
jgi:hypothetical protein